MTIADRNGEDGERVAWELGDRCGFVHHDVTDETGWGTVIDACVEHHGALDVLVNCAGVFRKGNIEDTTLAEWCDIVGVNLEGTFLGCRAAVKVIRKTAARL